MNLKAKRVVLGVSGGISAYKAADLCSRLVKAGALVDVIMTEAATRFVTPLTFQALTHRPISVDMFTMHDETDITHVSLGQSADLLIIAPATANTLAKLAHGLADNLLTTTSLAARCPILVAPAMESGMWSHPATQENMALLAARGVQVVGPQEGRLASGGSGIGRMAEPAEIIEAARWILGQKGDLAGQYILVSAGGTREAIDPVRYIGNRSSGKMGYAIALAARDRGAHVTLVTAPTNLPAPAGVEMIYIESAREMRDAILNQVEKADALIMAAAVADYRPRHIYSRKIKKSDQSLTLELERTPDILMEATAHRMVHRRPRVVVGFAAETEDLIVNAKDKLHRKGLDLIVANDITAPDSGFGTDTNRVVLIDAENIRPLPLLPKEDVADEILNVVGRLLNNQGGL